MDLLFLLVVPVTAALGYVAGRHRQDATLRGLTEMALARLFTGQRFMKVMLLGLRACRILPAAPIDLSLAAIGSVAFVVVHLCAPAWDIVPKILIVAGLSAYWHTFSVGKGARASGRKAFLVAAPPKEVA